MTTADEHARNADGPAMSEQDEPMVMDLSEQGDDNRPAEEPPAGETDDAAADVEAANTPDDQPCDEFPLWARVEALLFACDRPITEARLGQLLGLSGKGTVKSIRDAIDQLNAHYDESDRAFRIERLAGGYQVLTRSEYGPLLHRIYQDRQQSRLSQAALETLSIIAYRQPIIRAEIEAIRGVACGEVLRGLLERRLVKIVGRAEELGRPMLYGTTRDFLKVFGLSNLDDLPEVEGLNENARKGGSDEATERRSDEGQEEGDEETERRRDGSEAT
jgi:segregation and condensation protein B